MGSSDQLEKVQWWVQCHPNRKHYRNSKLKMILSQSRLKVLKDHQMWGVFRHKIIDLRFLQESYTTQSEQQTINKYHKSNKNCFRNRLIGLNNKNSWWDLKAVTNRKPRTWPTRITQCPIQSTPTFKIKLKTYYDTPNIQINYLESLTTSLLPTQQVAFSTILMCVKCVMKLKILEKSLPSWKRNFTKPAKLY